jgi:hypothetical protein
MNLNDVTVAIPLHNGADYSEIVFANIERLVEHCNLIVSDDTESDDLLEKVALKFGSHPNLLIVGKRNLEKGWVTHWNDLLLRIETNYFMWLPQDDEIEFAWISENLRNLINNPTLAGSFGLQFGNLMNELVEYGARLPSVTENSRKYLANSLIERWPAIGVATRSVWDKSKVLPILHTRSPNDEWADIIWIYGTLLQHPIGQVYNASYKKRWHSRSASSTWKTFDVVSARYFLFREINRRNLSLEPWVELLEICLAKQLKQVNDLTNRNNTLIQRNNEQIIELNRALNSKIWTFNRLFRNLIKRFKSKY